MWNRAYAWLVSIGLSLVVLWPIQRHLPDGRWVKDSFPISTYTMFSKQRPELEPATYMVALETDGTRHFVRYTHWASGGWNQGRAQIHRYKKGKAGGPDALCAIVSESIARSKANWARATVEVRMVRGEYDPERWFRDDHQLPVTEKLIASCPVEHTP